MKTSIDLNADLGEGCGDDEAIMGYISSCNIACGGHAGDAVSMRQALQLAKEKNVQAGAHPSWPDRENFGRIAMDLRGNALETSLKDQVLALKTEADRLSVPLAHVKPHGALYNAAALESELAISISRITKDILPTASIVGPPDSELAVAAEQLGLAFIAEGFADRAYEEDCQLRSRSLHGAVFKTVEECVSQALRLARGESVESFSGAMLDIRVDTICLHGDSPDALMSAKAIHKALAIEGIKVCTQ